MDLVILRHSKQHKSYQMHEAISWKMIYQTGKFDFLLGRFLGRHNTYKTLHS